MTAQKKVIVRRFLGDSLAGYLPGAGFVFDDSIALLDLAGRVTPIPVIEVKFIAYVRQFNLNEAAEIDRGLKRTFVARPRTEGLWVRITFRTGDTLEGVTPPGLALVDEILELRGLQIIPPDTRSNTQRIYVPRSSMELLDLLGVVSVNSRQRAPSRTRKADGQNELFSTPDAS